MARRYAHMIDAIHHDIADRIDGLLWSRGDDAPPPETDIPQAQLRPQLRPLADQPLPDEMGGAEFVLHVAVAVGFEPTVDFHPHTLSRRAP